MSLDIPNDSKRTPTMKGSIKAMAEISRDRSLIRYFVTSCCNIRGFQDHTQRTRVLV